MSRMFAKNALLCLIYFKQFQKRDPQSCVSFLLGLSQHFCFHLSLKIIVFLNNVCGVLASAFLFLRSSLLEPNWLESLSSSLSVDWPSSSLFLFLALEDASLSLSSSSKNSSSSASQSAKSAEVSIELASLSAASSSSVHRKANPGRWLLAHLAHSPDQRAGGKEPRPPCAIGLNKQKANPETQS
ncbi:hypothetical protein KCU85_g102, partial [Aureobasidium melanogenum]